MASYIKIRPTKIITASRHPILKKPVVLIKSRSCSITYIHHQWGRFNYFTSESILESHLLAERKAKAAAAAFAFLANSCFCSSVGGMYGGSILLETYLVTNIDVINTKSSRNDVPIPITVR